jgi:hypothetical protein
MACSVDIWTRISRPPPVPYPGLQNAGVRITPRTLTLLQLLTFSLLVIQLFTSLRSVSKSVILVCSLTSAIQVLPLTIARYLTFTGHHTSFAFTAISDGLFLSSGLLNVLLYAYTRPFLFPHTRDSADNRSIEISEFSQSRSDLPSSTILGNTRVVDKDPSLIETKSADPVSVYDAPDMAHPQPGTHPITAHAGDRDIGHNHESSGETLVRRGIPTVNIFDEV